MLRNRELRTILLVLLPAVPLAGCRSRPRTNPETVEALVDAGAQPVLERLATKVETVATEIPAMPRGYRIGVGDLLRVQVTGRPEFNGEGVEQGGGFRVQEDGRIYLPMIGPVRAAGRPVLELRDEVAEKLAKYLKQPFVTVDVAEYRSQRYFVLGAVRNPGVYPVDGRTTLLDAIARVGGAMDDADLAGAYVIRAKALLPISLDDLIVRGDLGQNIVLADRDYVFVPPESKSEVYVLGEVRKPGPVVIGRRGLSLAAAIATAGGIDSVYARKRELRIFRGGWAKPLSFTLSIEDVYRYGTSIPMRPNDRVIVAPNGLATWNRTLRLLLPFLQTPLTSVALSGAGVP